MITTKQLLLIYSHIHLVLDSLAILVKISLDSINFSKFLSTLDLLDDLSTLLRLLHTLQSLTLNQQEVDEGVSQ